MYDWGWQACRSIVRMIAPPLFWIGADPVMQAFLGGHFGGA